MVRDQTPDDHLGHECMSEWVGGAARESQKQAVRAPGWREGAARAKR